MSELRFLIPLVTALALPTVQSASAQATSPTAGGILLTQAQLSALKSDMSRFTALLRNCDANVNYQPTPLAVLEMAAHYNASGENAPTQEEAHLSEEARLSYRQALCYALTGELKYALSSQRILDAWGTTFKKVAPHNAQGNVNFNLPYMVIAASWVKNANDWNHSTFDTFLLHIILPMAEVKRTNNHGQWGIFMQATIGAYLGNAQLLAEARNSWQRHIQDAVATDGSMPREITRSDTSDFVDGPTKGIRGLAYTNYALLPATLAAQVFAVSGQPVWATPSGLLLQKAFGKAASWVLHPETFPYYASNNGKLQDTNDVGYFPVLLKQYPNEAAEAVLEQDKVTSDGFLLMELFGGK